METGHSKVRFKRRNSNSRETGTQNHYNDIQRENQRGGVVQAPRNRPLWWGGKTRRLKKTRRRRVEHRKLDLILHRDKSGGGGTKREGPVPGKRGSWKGRMRLQREGAYGFVKSLQRSSENKRVEGGRSRRGANTDTYGSSRQLLPVGRGADFQKTTRGKRQGRKRGSDGAPSQRRERR